MGTLILEVFLIVSAFVAGATIATAVCAFAVALRVLR